MRWNIFPHQKRVVWQGRLQLKLKNLSRHSCARRVLQHSSRGTALHLSAVSNRRVCQMRCIKSNCKFRRPNKNPMDYTTRTILEPSLLLAPAYIRIFYKKLKNVSCEYIYMPSDNEFVASVDRKKKLRNTTTTYCCMIQQNV